LHAHFSKGRARYTLYPPPYGWRGAATIGAKKPTEFLICQLSVLAPLSFGEGLGVRLTYAAGVKPLCILTTPIYNRFLYKIRKVFVYLCAFFAQLCGIASLKQKNFRSQTSR